MSRASRALDATAGGLFGTRRLVTAIALLLVAITPLPVAGARGDAPSVTVSETAGVFRVTAAFTVAHAPAAALAALTDYPRIPRFMPEVRTSNVLERSENRAIVEQEAVARFAMFSKRVYLVLEVQQAEDTLRFRDTSGRSFARYDGMWSLVERDGGTHITYELSADPTFDVPGFMLKRLLKRDAVHMLERLSAEISARAQQASRLQ